MQAPNVAEFRALLCEHLRRRSIELGVGELTGVIPSILFTNLIDALAAKSPDGQMVLLIDEYDKPLLGNLTQRLVDRVRAHAGGKGEYRRTFDNVVATSRVRRTWMGRALGILRR